MPSVQAPLGVFCGMSNEDAILWDAGLSLPGAGFTPQILQSMQMPFAGVVWHTEARCGEEDVSSVPNVQTPDEAGLEPEVPSSRPQSPSFTSLSPTINVISLLSPPVDLQHVTHLPNPTDPVPPLLADFKKRQGCMTAVDATLEELLDPREGRVPEYTYSQLLKAAIWTCGGVEGKVAFDSLVEAIAKRFPCVNLFANPLYSPSVVLCDSRRRWAETDHWKTAKNGMKNALKSHACFIAHHASPAYSTSSRSQATTLWSCDATVSLRAKTPGTQNVKKRKRVEIDGEAARREASVASSSATVGTEAMISIKGEDGESLHYVC